jgi:hypothetical protein
MAAHLGVSFHGYYSLVRRRKLIISSQRGNHSAAH